MEHVIKELAAVKKAVAKRTDSLKEKKVNDSSTHKVLFSLVEDALSKVYCKYALDLTQSVVAGAPSDKALHQRLDKTLQLLKKTKEIVHSYIQETEQDPIPEAYLVEAIQALDYTVVGAGAKSK